MSVRTVLLCALALRLLIVFLGGQRFNPDEARYDWAMEIPKSGLGVIAAHPGHPGFYILSLPVVLVHSAVASVLRVPPESLAWIPAIVNAFVSISILALIYGIGLRASGRRDLAQWAMGFGAASTPLLYYCRHLFPYDYALALGLLAVYLSLDPQRKWWMTLCSGFSAGLSAVVYNGTVLMCVIVLILAAWHLRAHLSKTALLVLGASIPVILVRIIGGATYWNNLREFSGTVVQGWFAEGASLPWMYLWATDHGLLLVLLLGVAVAFRTPGRRFAWAAVGLYVLLIVGSVGLQKWVVNARICRTLVPFFCIAAAAGYTQIADQLGSLRMLWMRRLFWSGVAIQCCFNFAPILAQRFPLDINREIMRMSPVVNTEMSIGSCKSASQPPVQGRLLLLNSMYLWPVECYLSDPQGKIVFQTPHPLQWLPYQFEGFSPQQRSLLQRADISIRLIQQ